MTKLPIRASSFHPADTRLGYGAGYWKGSNWVFGTCRAPYIGRHAILRRITMGSYRNKRVDIHDVPKGRITRSRGGQLPLLLVGVLWIVGGISTAHSHVSASTPGLASAAWGEHGGADLIELASRTTDQEAVLILAWNGARSPWAMGPGIIMNPTRPPHVPPQSFWCVCPDVNGQLKYTYGFPCIYGCPTFYDPPRPIIPPNIGFTR